MKTVWKVPCLISTDQSWNAFSQVQFQISAWTQLWIPSNLASINWQVGCRNCSGSDVQPSESKLDSFISGELPLSLIEKKARGCEVFLSGNTGFTLPDMSNLADDITKINLSDCSLTGNVNLDVHRSELKLETCYCDVLGSIPDFSSNTALNVLYLNGNQLSGGF